MDRSLLTALLFGTALMLAVTLCCRRYLGFPAWKIVLATLLLLAAGYAGTKLMFHIESGGWGGISFYGAVLFVPLLFVPVAPALRVRYARLMDLTALGVAAMLIVMKFKCCYDGCCYGRVLKDMGEGLLLRFPSQMAEAVNGAALLAVLLWWVRRGRHKGRLYPWYMVLYGATRFFWNCFRGDLKPFVWILPAGHFWSLVSIAAGCVWLFVTKNGKGAKDLEQTREQADTET